MTAVDNKALVLQWFSAGPSSDSGRSMLTPDFKWWIPAGMAGLLTEGRPVLEGPDAMLELRAIDDAAYSGGDTTFDLRYLVAEDDWVVMQAQIGARSHEGNEYSNLYVFSIRCAVGKIAEVWESADTKYWCDTIIGTPAQLEGVRGRLAAAKPATGVS